MNPDIELCNNDKCENKDTCLRFIIKPQAKDYTYLRMKNICNPNTKPQYKYYWQIKQEIQVKEE